MTTLESLQDLAANHPWALAASIALAAGTAAYMRSPHYKLRHIPTVGSSSLPLLSYFGNRYNTQGREIMEEGYERYHGRMFKVATMGHWVVVASGRTLLREIISLPDDTLSFIDGVDELTGTKYVVGKELNEDLFHIDVVKRDLTRNLSVLLPDIYDEIEQAYNEYIPPTEEWVALPAINTTMMVVARASNRIIVGLPYCRDLEYLTRCIMYTQEWSESTQAISKYPAFLKPIVAPFINKLPATNKRVGEIISPEIERRRKLMNEYGKDYPGKNNDFLTWMMDYSDGSSKSRDNSALADRIVQINFAAIHTSSHTFTHVLYTLAAKPEWVKTLREEIEPLVEAEGMTKASMQKMCKVDGMLREVNRMYAIAGTTMTRMAMKSHTFSDGTFVPAGTLITVPTMPHQMDGSNFENPNELDPSRFTQAKDGEATRKHFVTIDDSYLAFGLGKHACPGRFFAGNELKAMLVYLLLHYDIRTEEEGVRPPNMSFGPSFLPNMFAKVMFRKRQT